MVHPLCTYIYICVYIIYDWQFCSSRKSVVQSAEALAGDLRTNNLLIRFNAEALHAAAMSVHEHKLSGKFTYHLFQQQCETICF